MENDCFICGSRLYFHEFFFVKFVKITSREKRAVMVETMIVLYNTKAILVDDTTNEHFTDPDGYS